MNQSNKRGPWIRSCRRFPPVGCLGSVLLLLGFIAVILYLIVGFLRSSQVYREAIRRAKMNPVVMGTLGSPVREGFLVLGMIWASGSSGTADLSIPLSGPKGKAEIRAVAAKTDGKWTFSSIDIAFKPSGKRIDLLATSGLPPQALADKAGCPVPGELFHWQASYCMWIHETDDFLQANVQKCFDERSAKDEKTASTDCEKKISYRSRICEQMVQEGFFQGSTSDCMKSVQTIPRPVREGGI
jgi:hypothetical protein